MLSQSWSGLLSKMKTIIARTWNVGHTSVFLADEADLLGLQRVGHDGVDDLNKLKPFAGSLKPWHLIK